jgi:hypothetical protein
VIPDFFFTLFVLALVVVFLVVDLPVVLPDDDFVARAEDFRVAVFLVATLALLLLFTRDVVFFFDLALLLEVVAAFLAVIIWSPSL